MNRTQIFHLCDFTRLQAVVNEPFSLPSNQRRVMRTFGDSQFVQCDSYENISGIKCIKKKWALPWSTTFPVGTRRIYDVLSLQWRRKKNLVILKLGHPRRKCDSVVAHISERENRNWMEKITLLGEGFILLTRGYGFIGGCTAPLLTR